MSDAFPSRDQPGEPVPGLRALVVKQGVALGGLAEAQRALALGLVWAGLPRSSLTEPAVNAALRAQLATAARCLATDHVELRRWLCDSGWLQRDAWGRAYQRVAPTALPAPWRALGAALQAAFDDADTGRWVQACHDARDAQRTARRLAHQRDAGSEAAERPVRAPAHP